MLTEKELTSAIETAKAESDSDGVNRLKAKLALLPYFSDATTAQALGLRACLLIESGDILAAIEYLTCRVAQTREKKPMAQIVKQTLAARGYAASMKHYEERIPQRSEEAEADTNDASN